MDGGVDMVELGGLDEERRDGGGATGDQLKAADGSQKHCSLTSSSCVLPALAGLEAEGEEEGGETGEGLRGGDGVDECNAFDHDFRKC